MPEKVMNTNPQFLLLSLSAFFLLTCISSCFQGNPEEHNGFMSRSDCFVYVDQVLTEDYDFGQVEKIDTAVANSCASEQLKNTFILHLDNKCITIIGRHPKENIEMIKEFAQLYQSDSTMLSGVSWYGKDVCLNISRVCRDRSNQQYYGKYATWMTMWYSVKDRPYALLKNDTLYTEHNWASNAWK